MLEKHHIVFKSQGGLDFPLNYKHLTTEEHKGNDGPHLNRKKDLEFKKELQVKLENILTQEYYTTEELINILQLKKRQAYKAFRQLRIYEHGYERKDVIQRLMGGRFYV